ncbi:META domain-containing protein [Psychrobacter sp. K31L]|uniref:META domain-containing protein n=1 Tax=Psychrobacter sp. K31L TaxID=2820758 RepID=UPI001B31EF94|nr:META domain-containing protein [Psychrobacter sp. K31L]MBP3945388.1 META domain-containing protein [Psychrobacter sp. K31L]
MLNPLRVPLVVINTLLPLALLGCQTNSLNHSAQTSTVIDDKNWSATTLKPRLFQTITNYDWQLTHLSDGDDKLIGLTLQPPLTMHVRPDLLTFDDGCYRYLVTFDMWLPLPYPYTDASVQDTAKSPVTAADCTSIYQATTQDWRGNTIIPSDTAYLLNMTFGRYAGTNFIFNPAIIQSLQVNKTVEKQLALKTSKGKTLIFSGTPKPEHPVAGIPLTNELLERYRWQLVQVTDKAGAVLSEFTQIKEPIMLSYSLNNYSGDESDKQNGFQSGIYGQSFGVSVGCNGISGPYALSINQSLLTGSFPSTMMSCGDALDDVESRLRRMMTHSKSRLILTHADNKAKTTTEQSEPNYLLTQTLDSGETLVWQSEVKKTP